MAPCAEEVLISYKDQMRLNILPPAYPCFLGPGSGTPKYSDTIFVPEHPEDELEEEGYDPHVQLARHIAVSIIEDRATDIIPQNYRERSRAQEIWDAEAD